MDYKALAKQFGAIEAKQQPSNAGYAPFMSDLSPKDQSDLKIKMYNEDRKRVADLDAEIAKAEPTLRALERFGALNRESRTGGVWDNVFPSVPLLHGSDENEMYAIQAGQGPAQRIPGSGASSDRDVNLFLAGMPRVENPGNVNKKIREGFQNKYNYAISKKTAMEQYLAKNGHLNGFDAEWAKMQKGGQTTPAAQSGGVKFLGFE